MELEARLQLLELRQSLREAWSREIGELLEQRDALHERKLALTSDLSMETSLSKTVSFNVGGSGRLESGDQLTFTYRVPGARWTPSYVLRFDEKLTRVQTQLRALVAQETGEDWSEVELAVSSAALQEFRELPELLSVRIGKDQPPPPVPSWKPPPQDTDSLFQDFDRKLEREKASESPPPAKPLPAPSPEPTDGVGHLERGGPGGGGGAKLDLAEDDEVEGVLGSFQISAAAAPMEADLVKRRVSPKKLKEESFSRERKRPKPKPILRENPLARDYTRLVMRSVHQTERGQLKHQSLGEQVLAEARCLGLPAEDLEAQIEEAIRRAEQVTLSSLPSGCSPPEWPGPEQFDLYYRAKTRCSVPSDGAYHGQPLHSVEGECKSHYVAVPRETSQVFRTVEIVGQEALPPGPADIYLDKTFLLSGPFQGLPPGGLLQLALGVEERIEIARNTRFKESSSGVVSKSRNLEHTIEVELKNGLGRAAEVEIRERLPQPDQLAKDVEVTVVRSVPEWQAFEPEEQPGFKGGYRWRVSLEAGDRTKMEAVYTITLPFKYELEGGNRRD